MTQLWNKIFGKKINDIYWVTIVNNCNSDIKIYSSDLGGEIVLQKGGSIILEKLSSSEVEVVLTVTRPYFTVLNYKIKLTKKSVKGKSNLFVVNYGDVKLNNKEIIGYIIYDRFDVMVKTSN